MAVRQVAEVFAQRPHQRDGLGDAARLVAAILARRAEFTPADLSAVLLAVLRDRVFGDLEDPAADPELGDPIDHGGPAALSAAPAIPGDPRPGLDTLNVPWSQDVDPGYGYDGTFLPECVFAHWTASAAGTDTAQSVLEARHYAACAGRDGTAHLDGWAVRQGHGGSGRRAPLELAVDGAMTLDALTRWQTDPAPDDTSTGPNTYGVSVCLDNNGTGERPPAVQWHAFTALAASFLAAHGWATIGRFIDHDASTGRKIDLGHTSAFTAADYWRDITAQLQLLTGGPPAVTTAVDLTATPQGGYYVLADDGAVFTFGPGATFLGAANDGRLGSPAVALELVPGGYVIGEANGGTHTFGTAKHYGSAFEFLQ